MKAYIAVVMFIIGIIGCATTDDSATDATPIQVPVVHAGDVSNPFHITDENHPLLESVRTNLAEARTAYLNKYVRVTGYVVFVRLLPLERAYAVVRLNPKMLDLPPMRFRIDGNQRQLRELGLASGVTIEGRIYHIASHDWIYLDLVKLVVNDEEQE